MNLGRFLSRVAARAAATGMAVGYVGLATAADEPVAVAPAAPVADVCPTCTAGPGGSPCQLGGCRTCGGKHRAGCNPPKPIAGQLRPGACFGYFQTQWHRWEDVCPIPYQGVGVTDAPKRGPVAAPGAFPAPAGPMPKTDAPLPKGNPNPMPMPGPMGAGTPTPMPGVPAIPLPIPEKK